MSHPLESLSFHALFDAAADASLLTDWMNGRANFRGLGPEEAATYAKLLAGIYPADRVVTQAALDRALDPTGNGEYQADFRVIRPIDGIERWVSARGRIPLRGRACSTACGHPTGHHRA